MAKRQAAAPRKTRAAGRVTLREIAEATGVSAAAVGYALNGESGVSEDTRERIRKVADHLGYSGNMHARSLRTGSSYVVGLVARDLANPFFLDVISGGQSAAAKHDSSLLTMDSAGDAKLEEGHIRRLAAMSAEGLVISPVSSMDAVHLWELLCPGKPVVLLNAVSAATEGYSTAGIDRRVAISESINHLWSLGHRRIAFLELDTVIAADRERQEVFASIAEQLGLAAQTIYVPQDLDGAKRAVVEELRRPMPPTAVLANSDYYAMAVYAAAQELGLRVGRDLSVTGQDDLPTSEYLGPSLTTIRTDRRSIGEQAVRSIFETTGELIHYRAPLVLMQRESTGPAPTDR